MVLVERFLSRLKELDVHQSVIDRIQHEHVVRKAKRLFLRCPYNAAGVCTKTDIRCGEREDPSVGTATATPAASLHCSYDTRVLAQHTGVLIVDDDEVLRNLCRHFLISDGIPEEKISVASSVDEAEAVLRTAKRERNSFYLIITDVRMGERSGFELVDLIVMRNFNAYVIVMSGYFNEHDRPEGYLGDSEMIPGESQVMAQLQKPFLKRELLDAVQRIHHRIEAMQ